MLLQVELTRSEHDATSGRLTLDMWPCKVCNKNRIKNIGISIFGIQIDTGQCYTNIKPEYNATKWTRYVAL